ncbi:MAG: VWA domain-containing protein [Bifidobacterium psychraerophilum]|uniref:VWA domain-containing protein n=1 Tax=Bifidobacterium psychraerophilum TaxID=218140 RepID=UPI0039E953F9
MNALLIWRWPWAVVAAIVIALLALGSVWFRLRRSSRTADPTRDAYAWDIAGDLRTEEVSARYKLWNTLKRVAFILLVLALLLVTALVGRPSTVSSQDETSSSRDIVLCLDVSGSTLPYDREIISTYLDLVSKFQGERIALSIFNSTSRTVFPLTDDYSLVSKQLSSAKDILGGVQSQDDIDKMSDKQYQQISDWLDGTQNIKDQTSLIGDGLVSCAAMLPGFSYGSGSQSGTSTATRRSSSIVLATDNVVSGTPQYSLQQALELTKSAQISVDGIFAGPDASLNDASTKQMQTQIEGHGGVFLSERSGASIDELVREIDTRRGGNSEQASQSSLLDAPGWWVLGLSLVFLGYLITVWRLRR